MPRVQRVDVGGEVYHVLNRANARVQIFDNDEDYQQFEQILEESIEKFDMRLLAYCVMPNHWHLLTFSTQLNTATPHSMGYYGYMHTQAPIKRDRKALEQRRMKAARLFERDVPQYKIAERLKVTPAAVCIWHTAWEKNKEDGLKSKGPPGFLSQYTDEKKRMLKKIILQGPSKAGYTTDFWTIDRIRAVAKKKLHVDLGTKRTWQTLIDLGFSVQK